MTVIRSSVPEGPSAVAGRGHLITDADELLASWEHRDRLYETRPTPLTTEEVEAIVEQRVNEAGYVEPRRRHEVWLAAKYWRAPLPVKGGVE